MRNRWWRKALVVVSVTLVLGMLLPIGAMASTPNAPNADTVGQAHHFTGGGIDAQAWFDSYQQAQFQTVFPPDDRVRVTPTNTFPAIAVGLVLAGTTATPLVGCTGTLIGPQVVLTAAHCLYDPDYGGYYDRVEFDPGRDGDKYPGGALAGSQGWVPAEYQASQDSTWDVGLIKLQQPVGDLTSWFSIGVLDDATLSQSGFNPCIAGYPSDKAADTMWLTCTSKFLQVQPHQILTDLDVAPGQSGSAVWRAIDGMIVGIIIEGTTSFNVINRIDMQFLNRLIDACDGMRCSFSYYVEPNTDPILTTWGRTDYPVADHDVSRTWMWGPKTLSGPITEPYDEAPGGIRTVEYFDKSRMEITHPNGDPNSIWYVTNGLLVSEMVTGMMQYGDNDFVQRKPAQVPVAGDPDDTSGPTYATFYPLADNKPIPTGWKITQLVNRAGNITNNASLGNYNVTAQILVPQTNHTVASVFWDFMNSNGLVAEGGQLVNGKLFVNPFYATGYPIAEPYWANVKVGGKMKTVLVQCFQRRCLTYTPSNPSGWKVEAGNVGRHYYIWRYGVNP